MQVSLSKLGWYFLVLIRKRQTAEALRSHSHLKANIFVFVCVAAGSTRISKSGRPEERALSAEDQEAEPVSVKERLAMYQAAVSKKETSSSSSAAVRQYFQKGVTGDGCKDVQTLTVCDVKMLMTTFLSFNFALGINQLSCLWDVLLNRKGRMGATGLCWDYLSMCHKDQYWMGNTKPLVCEWESEGIVQQSHHIGLLSN